MSSLSYRLPSLRSLKLRPKLILAFAGMAVMAGLCGAIGLLFVDRIGASVSVFSDVTSPMLSESTALVDNARRMRSIVLRVVSGGENADRLPQQLSQLHVESGKHLLALHRLAEHAEIEVSL